MTGEFIRVVAVLAAVSASVGNTGSPVDICILVQNSGLNWLQADELWRAARAAFERIRWTGGRRFAIVSVEDRADVLLDMTDDHEAATNVFDKAASPVNAEASGLPAAINRAAAMFADGTRPETKKVVLLFLDHVDARPETVASSQALEAADVQVFVVLPSPTPESIKAATMLTAGDESKVLGSSDVGQLEEKIDHRRATTVAADTSGSGTTTSENANVTTPTQGAGFKGGHWAVLVLVLTVFVIG